MSEGKTRILFVVDIEGWAWGIIAHTLSRYLPEQYECKVIERDEFLKWDEFNPEEWSLVLCYIYKNRRALNKLDKRNTVIVIGSDPSTITVDALQYVGGFRYFLALNGKVYLHLLNIIPTKKIYFIMDGTDVEQFKLAEPLTESPLEKKPFRVGWVGTAGRPLKRFELAEKAVRLVDGIEFAPLKGLEDPSYIPHDKMHEYYQSLGCLLCTSTYEVHSTVLYEAMACGVPVVTTRTGDAEEFIEDGVNGYLLSYGCNEEEIANHIVLLRDNPEKCMMIGEESRATVVERLSWERVTPRYIDIFNRILKRGGVLGKRRIGFLWWESILGAELSVISLQMDALKRMGAEPLYFNPSTVFDDSEQLDKLNDCDLIFTSVMPLVMDNNRRRFIKTPILFQVDGYGATSFYDGYLNPQFSKLGEMVDIITFLDMNVYEEFRIAGYSPKPDEYVFVPNGINPFPRGEPTFKRGDEVIVGTLLKENMFKKPWIYVDSAKYNPEYRYPFPVMGWDGFLAGTMDEMGWRSRRWGMLLDFTHRDGTRDIDKFIRDNPDDIVMVRYQDIPNVEFIPHINYNLLGDYMESCDVFTHYSGGDAFAKTVTEAFSYGKAPIVSDIVRIQGVSVENLPIVKDCIGDDMTIAYHNTRNLYRTGNEKHLRIVPFNEPETLANITREYVNDKSAYQRLSEEAKRWGDEWITWEQRWGIIFGLAEDKMLI